MSIGTAARPARPAAFQPHEAPVGLVDLDLLAAVAEDLDDAHPERHAGASLWVVPDLGAGLDPASVAPAPALAA
ncbi:hypothetical protein [Nocardioides bruguierae]|uniref:Uncharacterized protein n=1 Tax=Nocardioides bruguierae TaxID=2945102 RepID=A0A9X2DAI4_9ACTN|nr:hypothetical protein [Nocardioides bruguierae]MCM0622308.1 hypothetical protein [Nocardioides bruguierae]